MGSRSTKGRNGCAPTLGKWYGALCQQVPPHGKWKAYIYYLNQKEEICLGFFDTDQEAKQTLEVHARALHGKRTNPNFSASAAPPPPMSKATFEYWQLAGGGVGFSHSAGYMHWQGDGRREMHQGPNHILWLGGDDDEGPQSSDSHHWQLGN